MPRYIREVTAPRSRQRLRRRFSRTFSRARWDEYRRLLAGAQDSGYELVSLEEWVGSPQSGENRTLVLRHDVDQHPGSALPMARIESELGVTSTWYFRWRTADDTVIRELRSRGFAVGLHYETLSRRALAEGRGATTDIAPLIPESRAILKEEIALFKARFGPIRSVAPHGDSRLPSVRNASLLRGEDCTAYGVEFDGNNAMRGKGIALWLTDRSRAEGSWGDGVDPHAFLRRGVSPILCLTHPNNWTSGPSLWLDRALATLLPTPAGPGPARPIRTRSDAPPLQGLRGSL
jgi:hypothetical protein